MKIRSQWFIIILAQKTACVARWVRCRGVRSVIQLLREGGRGLWLDANRIRALRAWPCPLRLQ